jgi:large subunit ribosomal protein L21
MSFAVLSLNGKQFKVSPGETFEVAAPLGKVGDKIKLGSALLLMDKDLQIGTPKLDISVNLEITEVKRGPKIEVSTFKSKSRLRKHIGYRDEVTVLKVIDFGKPKAK